MDLSFTQDPRYHQQVLRLARSEPYEQAAVDTVVADAEFADQDMRRRLALMRLAGNKLAQDAAFNRGRENLAFNKEVTTTRTKMAKQQRKDDNLALDIGTGIAALGAVGNAYLGHKTKQADLALARAQEERRKATFGA
jgi:ATP-dependent helicase YprA (DUF1998 family)